MSSTRAADGSGKEMRYKYKLPYRVKKACEMYLMDYPNNKKHLADYKLDMMPSMAQELTGMPKGGNASRQTEEVAMRIAQDPYVRQMEDSIAAVERLLKRMTADEKKFTEMVFFKKSHTIIGAGEVIGYSSHPAYAMANRIIGKMAEEKGLIRRQEKRAKKAP